MPAVPQGPSRGLCDTIGGQVMLLKEHKMGLRPTQIPPGAAPRCGVAGLRHERKLAELLAIVATVAHVHERAVKANAMGTATTGASMDLPSIAVITGMSNSATRPWMISLAVPGRSRDSPGIGGHGVAETCT